MSLPASLLNENNALAALSKQAGTNVTQAVYNASEQSGVDFGYLLKQAAVESSFNTGAQAKTSSARGLYQFIDSTWLEMVEKHGAKYGIDPNQSKSSLLALRDDPKLSSHMAAEFAEENKAFLEDHWAKGAKDIGATELYLAHFMGAGGATSFLKAKDANPLQPAAELFGSAARANKSIFFEKQTNRAHTLQEVYDRFAAKFEGVDVKSTNNATMIAQDSKDSFTQYSEVASRFYQDFSSPASEKTSLNNLFINDNSSALSVQKLWSMSTVDFVSLLKNS